SERGRYLGLVLFSAQQFRSQVQRRVVGNAGTGVFGRMDMDELATPAYATLSPATKIKLATLPKGELMVRHPHFNQPIFVPSPPPTRLRPPPPPAPARPRGGGPRPPPPPPPLPPPAAAPPQHRAMARGATPAAARARAGARREEGAPPARAPPRRERPDDALAF